MNANHFFHLRFASGAVAGEDFFDFVWRIFIDWEMELFGDEKNDAASFGNHDTGSDVFAKEKFFDRKDVWLGLI